MKLLAGLVIATAFVAAFPDVGRAQVGKPVTIVDANLVTEADLAKLPHILLLPGALVIRAGGEAIAAIGVGGAPGGDLDEACAKAGLDKISDRLK